MKTVRTLIVLTTAILLFGTTLQANTTTSESNISFFDAWKKVAKDSDAITAAQEHVEQAQFHKDAAKDMYFPEIGI